LPCLFELSTSLLQSSNSIANLPAIIGGSIGGFLVLLFLSIILAALIFRKRINSLFSSSSIENPYDDPYSHKQGENLSFPDSNMYSEANINKTDSIQKSYETLKKSNTYDYLYPENLNLKEKSSNLVQSESNFVGNVILIVLNEKK